MTATTPSPTAEDRPPGATAAELEGEAADIRARKDAADNEAGAAVARAERLRGLQRRDPPRATQEEVNAAKKLAGELRDEASALASALATIEEEELPVAREREREERLASKVERAKTIMSSRGKATSRLDRALSNVGLARSEVADFDSELAAIRAEVADLRDVDAAVQRIRAEFLERYEERRRTAPPGMEPNVDTLERQQTAAINALRAAVDAEAAAIAPEPGADAIDAILAKHEDTTARILAPATRQALAEGSVEFLRRPHVVMDGTSFVGQTSTRIYSSLEAPIAEARYAAFANALQTLKGDAQATPIGQAPGRGTRDIRVSVG